MNLGAQAPWRGRWAMRWRWPPENCMGVAVLRMARIEAHIASSATATRIPALSGVLGVAVNIKALGDDLTDRRAAGSGNRKGPGTPPAYIYGAAGRIAFGRSIRRGVGLRESDGALARNQPEQGETQGGLARAAFTHQAQGADPPLPPSVTPSTALIMARPCAGSKAAFDGETRP